MENNNFNGEKISSKQESNNINSIRNIEVSERTYNQENRFQEIPLRKKNTFFKKLIWLIIILGIVAGILTYFFHSVDFKIKSNIRSIPFSNDIIKANNFNTKSGEELPFKLLSFDFSSSKDVKSKIVETVSEKAEGKIKIINNTSKVQKLRKETRFEVDGKIFKTYKSVTIPAKSSVVKEAFADVAGEEYNLKKGLKMVVPGFKEVGDLDSYKMITGEIAESFRGGFVGKKDIPDKDDFDAKKKELVEELKSKVMIKVIEKMPEGFILNTDGVFEKYDFETKTENGSSKIIGTAKVKAIIFNEKDFLSVASGLSKDVIKKYDVDKTIFLKFKILNKEDVSIDSLKDFNFELNGELKYHKKFEKDDFIQLVKGKSELAYKRVLENNYSDDDFIITKTIFPFWMTKIPDDISKISVEIVED